MLQLKQIVKHYGSGENMVTALNGVDITFRENEFVAILGHSGCGKTTLLNIIGGLDHYTSGDLIINGISTKKYKDRDWDAYRNHSIGFIFQSYNLIPHQSVLANVELALTISGVSKSERRKRAKEALEKVGLGNQLHKRPNQMSGGQMQRVAIARALINNPDILLADEPTGALDSETSIQVMELLKEIAKDKLVIMVTHNPELAEQYATRIVRIKDGQLTSDSNEFIPEKEDSPVNAKKKRVSMSFFTAVSLSLNNLLTKKGRTLLTAFAGSIGIIGIALILSLSTGINEYIDGVQEETLASYPISIDRESTDMTELFKTMFGGGEEVVHDAEEEKDTVYAGTEMYDTFNNLNSSAKQINNMAKFKKFVDTNDDIKKKSNAVSYGYDVQMPIFSKDDKGNIVKSDLNEIYMKAMGYDQSAQETAMIGSNNSMMQMWSVDIWEEMLPADNGKGINQLIYDKYDLVKGSWPEKYNEVVVVLDQHNQIPDMITYALGLKSTEGFGEIIKAAMRGEVIKDYGKTKWSFSELMDKEYKLILPCEYYERSSDGRGYTDLTKSETGLELLYNNDNIGTELKVVGFIKRKPDVKGNMIQGYIGYTKELTDYIINKNNDCDVIREQLADKNTDVVTGKKFRTDDYKAPDNAEKAESAKKYIESLNSAGKAEIARYVMSQPSPEELQLMLEDAMKPENREQLFKDIESLTYAYSNGRSSSDKNNDSGAVVKALRGLTDEQFEQYAPSILQNILPMIYASQKTSELSSMSESELVEKLSETDISDELYVQIFDIFTPEEISDFTYSDALQKLGYADFDDPAHIRIYAKSFEDKDAIADIISDYNDSVDDEADVIHYTDFVAMLMSSVTNIITGISYLLIAFVGISLVVSSIMIGIITYISVLERTREIGILRAIGASKHDVSTVFNAETLLVGLTAGIIGILVSVLLTIPINLIIHSVTSLDTLRAHVPVTGAVVLILISMFLTFIAGLIPSRLAAKKDPVVALRTE
ncbi:MAG: ABC transporter ATP-binding protein/permease [Ruminococcus sp.]|nr:ABC transporter ATP-binding protein/permease [Ruminococcus sp.]